MSAQGQAVSGKLDGQELDGQRGDGKALVRFKDVQKSYDGETLVVKRLSLDIRQGEFLTLLGPSGSGKTTTLMMLAGFETPTHGEIELNGSSITHMPPEKRNIGMVFQNYALFPHMTVAENLSFPLEVRKYNKAEIQARIRKSLEMVRLDAFANRRPGQLSGGQQQRVALARALVFEPELVLMDEPLGALDKQLREHMQIEIRHLHQSLGITVVYVTHDQSEALTMSDRIAVFNDGIIHQLASPSELYERPSNAFVAQFIGENNRLHGKVAQLNGQGCTVELSAGFNVQALPVNVDGQGSPVTLSLRPERLKLDPQDGTMPNLFNGEVVELIYLGDHTRVRVAACGADDLIVKVPNSEGVPAYQPGQPVRIGWRLEDCRALAS
ncbi:MAG: ABC transporter ATP-binding protein [Rhodospirillaceae bacterium]|nr:MAG: ABC transporter ATP-binding protein [Rhodospirillaceae bacterium]